MFGERPFASVLVLGCVRLRPFQILGGVHNRPLKRTLASGMLTSKEDRRAGASDGAEGANENTGGLLRATKRTGGGGMGGAGGALGGEKGTANSLKRWQSPEPKGGGGHESAQVMAPGAWDASGRQVLYASHRPAPDAPPCLTGSGLPSFP